MFLEVLIYLASHRFFLLSRFSFINLFYLSTYYSGGGGYSKMGRTKVYNINSLSVHSTEFVPVVL